MPLTAMTRHPHRTVSGFTLRPGRQLVAAFALVAVALHLTAGDARADSCRIAFDMGSSGIRAGASNSAQKVRRELDALTPLWAGKGIASVEPAVSAALRELPREGGFADDCVRVGGGFSAWRLALQQDPAALVENLRRIRATSGVAVLVIPPQREGAYGYAAAKQKIGARFATTHALDIGGGSLQVAGEHDSFAAPLGQKSWHRLLCNFLRDSDEVPCALQPMNEHDLTRARALLAVRLADSGLPEKTTMTAISRPVTRGVFPAVQRIVAPAANAAASLAAADVRATIARLAPLDVAATAAQTGGTERHAAFLLSDLLLVQGLIGLTADGRLDIAETDLDNIPGLLADERAYAWARRYDCYLERLGSLGLPAFDSSADTCPAEPAAKPD